MAYEISYEGNGRGVIVSWFGFMSVADLLAVREKIYGDDSLPVLRYHIADGSKLTGTDASSEDARSLAIRDRGVYVRNPHLVVAVVEGPLGLAVLYKLFAEVWSDAREIRMFRTIDAAREWIATRVNAN